MIIYRNFDSISGDYTSCIGFFDGVHRGHQFLLQNVCDEARRFGQKSAVVTFSNHPRLTLQPDFDLQLIDTLDERLAKLDRMGVDACFLIDFTAEVRNMSARQFLQEFLCAKLHVRRLIIGYDHRFGRNRSEGFDDYVRYGSECGMQVIQAPVFNDGTGLHYSSSEVRRALQEGDHAKARQLLGWD